MTYDFLMLDDSLSTPLYQQLYQKIRAAVEAGRLKTGEKLPSIRKLADDLNLSRTTVETAYQQLCVEGYVKSRPQSGYYILAAPTASRLTLSSALPEKQSPLANSFKTEIFFDFGTDYVDRQNSDLKNWRKHVRDALNQRDSIVSYGDSQGELQLRNALSSYSYGVRGVSATPEQIVIGAGTQPLLYILCGLLQNKQIALEEQGFTQAERVFADCGIKTLRLSADGDGISPSALKKSGLHTALISPSRAVRSGTAMPVNRRQELLKWANEEKGILIEDDYNGELRYNARPVPAIQGMADGATVVYIGSFSKLLLPSVRISYMVLPPKLLKIYLERVKSYNQTASKIEQLALASYIKSGQLERQLRRMRKLYAEKSTQLIKELHKYFEGSAQLYLQETSLCLSFLPKKAVSANELCYLAAKQGVRVVPAKKGNGVLLGFAGILLEDIPKATAFLHKAWQSILTE